jgi:hypothetical protein
MATDTQRRFDLGDILSITDGRLVSPRHIEGVYDILNWMTGDNLFTHQLPRASRECKGPLLAQHPQLANVEFPDSFHGSMDAVLAWLDGQKLIYGATLPVAPLAKGQHEQRDPIEEACDIIGTERVFVFPLGHDQP